MAPGETAYVLIITNKRGDGVYVNARVFATAEARAHFGEPFDRDRFLLLTPLDVVVQ